MNVKQILKLACYQGIDISQGNNKPVDQAPEVVDDSLQSVLDEIFSVDENSGLPKGDIQYYLSGSGNPVVKQWLENNLLRPRVSSGSSLEGVTDDVINEFSRGSGESVSDYQARLMSLYDSAKAEYDKSLNVPKDE